MTATNDKKAEPKKDGTQMSLERITRKEADAMFVQEIGGLVKQVAWSPLTSIAGIAIAAAPDHFSEPLSTLASYGLRIGGAAWACTGLIEFAGGLASIYRRTNWYLGNKKDYVRTVYDRELA